MRVAAMRREYWITAVFLAASLGFARADVSGHLMNFDDQRVLHVWGTPYERGFAQGYYLSDDIDANLRIYAFPPPGESTIYYEAARALIMHHFTFPPAFVQEAQGVVDGMTAAGLPTYVDVLERDLDANDILTFNGLTELSGILCAALTAWGDATSGDPELGGALAIAHNTDYIVEPDDPYVGGRTGIIIAQDPPEDGGYGYATVAYPGILGVIAGMNDAGLGIVANKGAYDVTTAPDPDTEWVVGVWNARLALTTADYDGDGADTIGDLLSFYDDTPVHSPSILQFFGRADNADPPAAVLEANYEVRALRQPNDPNLPADVMLTLNWEDALMPVRSETAALRYWHSVWLVTTVYENALDLSKLWNYLWEARGGYDISVTLHSMIFVPDLMRVGASYWTSEETVPATAHQWYDYADLFAYPPDPDDDTDDDMDDDADNDSDDDVDDDADDDGADDDQADDDGESGAKEGDFDDGCGC